MREELLAHLEEIFAQERERLGDEGKAAEEAARRFGDPRELSRQLQPCVPRRDALTRLFERQRIWQVRRGESPWKCTARDAGVFFALYCPMVAILPPILWLRGRAAEFKIVAPVLLEAAAAAAAFMFAFTLLIHGMRRCAVSHRWATQLAADGGPGTGVGGILAGAGHDHDAPRDRRLVQAQNQFGFLALYAPLMPLALAGMAWLIEKEMRYQEEWASLEIDG